MTENGLDFFFTLTLNCMFEMFQSSFRMNHNTEKALLTVAFGWGWLLDLNADFNTVDHQHLLNKLSKHNLELFKTDLSLS